eukprot:m.185824 g.185824  ORF g.185824 m.185824 type:complete len:73 (+) comp25572_c0_seq4:95-313(+)
MVLTQPPFKMCFFDTSKEYCCSTIETFCLSEPLKDSPIKQPQAVRPPAHANGHLKLEESCEAPAWLILAPRL